MRIHPFYGGPFSQWAPSVFTIDSARYNCAEQYMMAQKARLFGDPDALDAIMTTADPSRQKAIGKKVRAFVPGIWAQVSRDVVARGSMAKFTQNPALLRQLMKTRGSLLVEASPTDIIWGVGLDEFDERVHDPAQWRGTNWLGQVLTDLREALWLAGCRR